VTWRARAKSVEDMAVFNAFGRTMIAESGVGRIIEVDRDGKIHKEIKLKVAKNDDTRVAKIDWLYMTYRRMGREAEAKSLLEPMKKSG